MPPLPPKRSLSLSKSSPRFVEERRTGLETYMRCVDLSLLFGITYSLTHFSTQQAGAAVVCQPAQITAGQAALEAPALPCAALPAGEH